MRAGPIRALHYKRRAKLLAQKYRCEINGKVGSADLAGSARTPKSPHLESDAANLLCSAKK